MLSWFDEAEIQALIFHKMALIFVLQSSFLRHRQCFWRGWTRIWFFNQKGTTKTHSVYLLEKWHWLYKDLYTTILNKCLATSCSNRPTSGTLYAELMTHAWWLPISKADNIQFKKKGEGVENSSACLWK